MRRAVTVIFLSVTALMCAVAAVTSFITAVYCRGSGAATDIAIGSVLIILAMMILRLIKKWKIENGKWKMENGGRK